MSKQDGYASRTAADLERKYNFGKTFAEVYGLVSDAQKVADEAKEAIDNLDQEAIFNLLTNFGQAQGVYRGDDGNVYINASYIKSGKLAADYIDAENLKVAAANITGELVATQINTKDLKVLAANITGTLTAGQIDATNLEVSAANITGTLKASQIDASNLKVAAANITGTLMASQIDASSLKVNAANITGSLTFGQLPGTVASTSDIPTHTSQLTNNSGYIDSYTATVITENAISTAYISASRITAGTLDANSISLSSMYGGFESGYGLSSGVQTRGAKMYGSSSDYYVFVSGSGVRLQASGTEFYVTPNKVYSSLAIVEGSSDRRTKNSISYDMDKYEQFFCDLKPCFFKFNTRPDEGYNLGFIAQDVEEALLQNELGKSDFAGLTTAIIKDENGEYSERYALILQQFVALNTHMIQKLKKRVEELEVLNA